MKLTVGNVLLLCAIGCIVIWVAIGFISYYTVTAIWAHFH